MKDPLKTGFADRIEAANEAKKALVAKLKPKPMVAAPVFESREEIKARELASVRQARAEEAALEAKRGERKERKALTKAEQKAKRDAKYAARKAGRK